MSSGLKYLPIIIIKKKGNQLDIGLTDLPVIF